MADLLLCLLEGHAQALRLALGLGEGLLQALAVPATRNAGDIALIRISHKTFHHLSFNTRGDGPSI
jgi:hypothetical protein